MLVFQCSSGWLAITLLVLLSLVAANPPAHSLEKTGFYYIYRSAVTAYGKKQKKIAPGLKKATLSHPDGGANYREFINHIGGTDFTDAQLTAAGVDLENPTVESATKFLLSNTAPNGKKGSGTVDSQMLKPFATGPGTTAFKYWDQIAKMQKVHEKAYKKITKEGKDTTGLDANRDKLLEVLKEVDVVRKSDTLSTQPGVTNVKGLKADLPNMIPGAQLELTQSTWKWDTTRTIYEVDLAKTQTASGSGVFKDINSVKKAVRGYGKIPNGNKYDPAYTHYRVHKAYRTMRKMVKPKKSC